MIKFFANVDRHKFLFIFGLIASVLLLLGRFHVTQSVIGGDAVYYYVNVRSLVIDRDLDFQNEYRHFYNEVSAFTGNRKIRSMPGEDVLTGRLPNRYPLGSAIALVPFFAFGHILSLLLNRIGFMIPADGYGPTYQLSVGFGGLFYGFIAIVMIYHLGKRLFDPITALVGAIAIWLATPLIYYMTMEPLMSHTISVFAVTLFVFLWYVTRERRHLYQWIALGLVGGLMSIVRYQDSLFLLIPVIDTVVCVIRRDNSLERSWRYSIISLCIFLIATSLVISVQLYVNRILYGFAFTTGYAGEGFPYWNSPKLFFSLFSTQSGLLLWSPVVAFSLGSIYWSIRYCYFPLWFNGTW